MQPLRVKTDECDFTSLREPNILGVALPFLEFKAEDQCRVVSSPSLSCAFPPHQPAPTTGPSGSARSATASGAKQASLRSSRPAARRFSGVLHSAPVTAARPSPTVAYTSWT